MGVCFGKQGPGRLWGQQAEQPPSLERPLSGRHLAEVSSQLQAMGLAQGLLASLAAGLLQQVSEALSVRRNSLLQVLLPLPQLQEGGIQGSEVVHGDLQG